MDLDGVYDPANIFAKMLRGEFACVKVFEDDVALAIMDIFPQSPGHTLVIAKTPARHFLDMPRDTVGPYLERVQKIARGVRKALAPDGLQIKQYNGAAAGQSVFHVHFHIIPRWADMDIAPHGGGKADMAELESQAAQIAAAL